MLKFKTNVKCFLISLSFLAFFAIDNQAQDISRMKDLSTIKVDNLSEVEIQKIRQQLTNSGVTIDDVRSQLIAKGLSPSEFLKLKSKLLSSQSKKSNTSSSLSINPFSSFSKNPTRLVNGGNLGNNDDSLDIMSMIAGDIRKSIIDPRIYGSELFNFIFPGAGRSTFLPDFKIATPVNYELGPGDEINLVIFGQQEYTDNLLISADGYVNIFNVGLVKLSGLTVESAQTKLKILSSKAYPTLSTGKSKLILTLSNIRTIHVTVIGSNFPGSIDVPSLSTVYSVLSYAGGPSLNGSFRNIELVRNSKTIKVIDLYRLLAKGDQSDNIRLQDNDIIRIPSYTSRVELQGQYKRPGIFEVKPNETFRDILEFAGGFDDTAYTAVLKVVRKNSRELQVIDLFEKNFDNFKLQSGDQVTVSKILNRFSNRIKISGAVFRPDIYEFKTGMRVSDLISRADGVKEDAFMERGMIIRLRENLTKEILSFSLKDALAKNEKADYLLKKEDEVIIPSLTDMKDSLSVTIQGEIHHPGKYYYMEGLTLKDLLLQSGGLTDAAAEVIEVGRLIRRDSISASDLRVSSVHTVKISDSLTSNEFEFKLEPYDVVNVRKKVAYDNVGMVLVVGQTQHPGVYALQNVNERVSDLILRVGGLLPDANKDGIHLKRYKSDEEKKRISDAAKRMQSLNSEIGKTVQYDIEKDFDMIPIDLDHILSHKGEMQDVILRSRDELIVPKMDDQVKISGAVIQSTQVPFSSSNSFRSYIYASGGYSKDAWRKRSHIVYANGKAASVRSFFIFRKYPKVKPGSEIIIPQLPESKIKGLSTGEIVGLSSAIASLAGVVIAILKL